MYALFGDGTDRRQGGGGPVDRLPIGPLTSVRRPCPYNTAPVGDALRLFGRTTGGDDGGRRENCFKEVAGAAKDLLIYYIMYLYDIWLKNEQTILACRTA